MPDHRALGSRLKKVYNKQFKDAISALTHDQLAAFEQSGSIDINGETVTAGELRVQRSYRNITEQFDADGDNDVIVVLDCLLTDDLLA